MFFKEEKPMTTGNIALTIIEVAAAALIIAGLFNEEKLARLEDRLFAAVKRRFKKGRKAAGRHNFTVIEGHSSKLAS